MADTIIVRYSEIALKGKNRADFERQLQKNITACTGQKTKRFRGRILVLDGKEHECMSRIFGIVSYSYAIRVPYSIENVCRAIDEMIKPAESFRITSQRVDNSASTGSQEINRVVGQHVVDKYGMKVNLGNPELEIGFDIIAGDAYIYTEKLPGPGGLPYGTGGKAYALIEDDKSLLAAWMVMRRGVRVQPVAYSEKDISSLEKFSCGFGMKLQIVKELPSGPIVTGQSLGEFRQLSEELVLRPLVGMDASEIRQKLIYMGKGTAT